jgi:hypothetical protein
MGFLERARSQRGRHQRQRSVKVDQVIPEPTTTTTTTSTTPASTRPSTTKSKRKSFFPGTGATTTSCEATRPRSRSAVTGFYSQANSTSRNDQRSYPPNMQFVTGNDSFRFPSPALVNNSTKKSPPTSVAHLPPLTGDNDSPIFTPRPQQTPRQQPPTWTRSHTAPMMGATQLEALPAVPSNWEDKQQRPQLKKQKSAWKTFGSFFKGSSKQARQPIPDQFYQIQPPSNDNLAKSGNTRMGVLDSPVPSPVAKDEPTVSRVDSGHGAEKGSDSLMPPVDRDAFPMRTSSRVSANFFDPMPGSAGDSSGPRRTPRLDVNIPDSGMDRYSVMFEKLLEPKVSLIERRKSKRLNNKDSGSPVGGQENSGAKKSGLQRSMTSPSLNREPSLTIHIAHSNRANRASMVPHPTKARVVSIRPHPPRRSMTAPSNDSTPISVPFESKTPNTAVAAPLPASTTTASSPRCSIMSENSLPPTPNTATSISSSINTTVFGPSSSPPTASKSNHASSSKLQDDDAPPVPALPNRSGERPTLPRQISGTERFNRQIVQVSVARQVSVSKARRRVADATEVKQPLRPRVVELGKNRKSTLVLIEGGD